MAEPSIRSVDRSGRVVLPADLCSAIGWISGEGPVGCWLLVQTHRRLRLLSRQDVEADSLSRHLREMVAVTENKVPPLDLGESALAVLAGQLKERDLIHTSSGWKLTLPRSIIALWRISSESNDVAIVVSDGYIEIWSIVELAAAYDVPLERLL